MNLITPENPVTIITPVQRTRSFILKKETEYKIPSNGLICSWKIKTPFIDEPTLIIDGNRISLPLKDPSFFDWKEIRTNLRELCPMTEEETKLDTFEHRLFGYQLYAVTHYPKLTNNDFFNALFTNETKCIQLDFGETGPDEVEIEETFWDRKGVEGSEITCTEEDLALQEEIKKAYNTSGLH